MDEAEEQLDVVQRIALSIQAFIVPRNRRTVSICKTDFYGITADGTTETYMYFYQNKLFLIRPPPISSARQKRNFLWFSHSKFLPQMLRYPFQFKMLEDLGLGDHDAASSDVFGFSSCEQNSSSFG